MKPISLLVLALLLMGCTTAAKVPEVKPQSSEAPTVVPKATTSSSVKLRAVFDGPDEKGTVRGKVVNDTQGYISGVELTFSLDGVQLERPYLWSFGDLRYYTLAPGEEFPFVAHFDATPADRIDAAAVGAKASRSRTELSFLPEPAGGALMLGRLTGGSRLLKAYELESTRVYLVPLDEGGLPVVGAEERSWELSFGADLDHLNQPSDLPPGGQLVVKYRSIRPDDWQATRRVIDSGRYKVVVSRWRPAPDFPVSATGEILTDHEVRYLSRLAPGEGEIERMTYQEYRDKYTPGDYSYQIGDQTMLFIITTKGTLLHARAGQYFNRHRSLMNAVTGAFYGQSNWWDPVEGPQPQGPGRGGHPPNTDGCAQKVDCLH